MAILNKVGVMSVAKVTALIYAIIGLVVGILYALAGSAAVIAGGADMLAGLGILAIIAAPISYAIVGFIGGAICALLYNVVAAKVGGIQLELDDKMTAKPTRSRRKK